MLLFARQKVVVFLDDWFISVGFKSRARLPPITNGLAYIAPQDKNIKGHQSCKPKLLIKLQADYNMLMVMPIDLLGNP